MCPWVEEAFFMWLILNNLVLLFALLQLSHHQGQPLPLRMIQRPSHSPQSCLTLTVVDSSLILLALSSRLATLSTLTMPTARGCLRCLYLDSISSLTFSLFKWKQGENLSSKKCLVRLHQPGIRWKRQCWFLSLLYDNIIAWYIFFAVPTVKVTTFSYMRA